MFRANTTTDYMNNVTLLNQTMATPGNNPPSLLLIPEEKALHWLIYDDPMQLSPDTPGTQFRMRQRYALRTLWFTQPSDMRWRDRSGWLTSEPDECQWFGVACQRIDFGAGIGVQLAVSEVAMRFNNVRGFLPVDLGLLSSMLTFGLRSNSVTGTLPTTIGQWTSLILFDMYSNMLTATLPTEIGRLTNLQIFSLYKNVMRETIPMGWSNISQFEISENTFGGTLSSWIGEWWNLTLFSVHTNEMTGIIPDSIGNWKAIVETWFYYNKFTGSVPYGTCDAPILEELEADCQEESLEVSCSCCTLCWYAK